VSPPFPPMEAIILVIWGLEQMRRPNKMKYFLPIYLLVLAVFDAFCFFCSLLLHARVQQKRVCIMCRSSYGLSPAHASQ
jgi:hypothetical protein